MSGKRRFAPAWQVAGRLVRLLRTMGLSGPADELPRTRWPADTWEMWRLAFDDGVRDRWVEVPDWMGPEMQAIYEDGWREGRSPW